MPEPNAVVIAASAVLVFMMVVALAAMLRHRDPVGRAVAGHAHLLGALRDTAVRSTKAPAHFAGNSQGDNGNAGRGDDDLGVVIVRTGPPDEKPES